MTDRKLSDADADVLATKIVTKAIEALKDEAVVDSITNVWAGHLDRHIGRTIRRGLYTILAALCILVGLKFDAVLAWLRGN
jgi:hypothetical protein